MKARVQTGAVLLCCFENPDEQDALRRFFAQRRIAVYTAGSEDLGRAVGPLLGQPGGAAQPQDAWRSCGVSAAPSHPKRRLRRAAPAHKTRRGYPAKSGEP